MHKEIAVGIIISTFLLCLVGLFFGILIKLYVKKIKNYTRLIYEKDLSHQKALTSSVIETQEQVLNNISRDLHDDAGQQLTFINFQLENLKLDSPELMNALQPVSDSLRNLSDSIRGISHALNNQLLLQQDLIRAIDVETERLSRYSPFSIRKSITGTDRHFTTDEKIVIYRIFQEIMSNILRHAAATEVSIFITTAPHFIMAITDDGRGFDGNSKIGSLGIINMKQRAAIIDFQLDIRTSNGSGTTITLSEKQG